MHITTRIYYKIDSYHPIYYTALSLSHYVKEKTSICHARAHARTHACVCSCGLLLHIDTFDLFLPSALWVPLDTLKQSDKKRDMRRGEHHGAQLHWRAALGACVGDQSKYNVGTTSVGIEFGMTCTTCRRACAIMFQRRTRDALLKALPGENVRFPTQDMLPCPSFTSCDT
jgi:hypothetical protein